MHRIKDSFAKFKSLMPIHTMYFGMIYSKYMYHLKSEHFFGLNGAPLFFRVEFQE